MLYALERFWLHIYSSPGLTLALMVCFCWIWRRYPIWQVRGWWNYIIPCLPMVLVGLARETIDVYYGQPLYKAFTDWASWFIGPGLSSFAVYRISNWYADVNIEIRHGRRP